MKNQTRKSFKTFYKIFTIITAAALIIGSALSLGGCKKGENMKPEVTLTFNTGDVVRLELYRDIAPLSVNNFLAYAKAGFYENTLMHRVIEGFMIQGGGFYIENNAVVRKTTDAPIKGEFSNNGYSKNTLAHTAGVISCARTTDKNSATSQFFICSADAPHLNGNYAAFGKVKDEESLAAVIRISKAATYTMGNFENFPREPIYVVKAEIKD